MLVASLAIPSHCQASAREMLGTSPAPGLSHAHKGSRLHLPNIELDNDGDEISNVEDAEDPMDLLECSEDSIWEALPFRNLRHHEKIR